jgi:hypothetical protein
VYASAHIVGASIGAPVIAHKTFVEDGETLAEGLPGRAAREISSWGADLTGANCTVGPQRMVGIIGQMADGAIVFAMANPTPEVMPEEALPWIDLEPSVELDNQVASVYFSYLVDRPDSVLAALRTIARAPGVALVHCAAGKDRTGTIVALALSVADAERQAIIDDYAASSERVEQVVERLMASRTYAGNLEGRPMSSHLSRPEAMISLLRYIDETFGGVLPMLIKMGWTADDTDQLRAKLRHLGHTLRPSGEWR